MLRKIATYYIVINTILTRASNNMTCKADVVNTNSRKTSTEYFLSVLITYKCMKLKINESYL